MERIVMRLSGLPVTILGGMFLGVSLILMLTGASFPIDPAWATVILCGLPLAYWAVRQLIEGEGMRKISSSLLITIAMIASVAIGEVFAAGEVAFIMAVGEILEDKTVERARKGIRRLIGLIPETARRVLPDGAEESIPVSEIRAGDVLRILPGETIPVDGEIVLGSTSVDQSVITGESLPVDRAVGEEVYSGAINRFGSIDIRATRVGEDSSLQKLIRLVQEAEDHRAPMQRIVDKWAAWLVPAALLIAVATYFITSDVVRAVTVLVVFCPCALVLATPTSIMAAIGQAAKHGVIIKSGEALENMGKADVVAFDKTGTLTYGELTVSDLIGEDENELLALAAAAEARSEHPLGKAILAYAKEKGMEPRPVEEFSMEPGKGVRAMLEGRELLAGHAAYLAERSVSIGPEAEESLSTLRSQGKAAVLIAWGGAFRGIVALSDTLKPTAKAVIEALQKAGARAVLLSGDHAATAEWFAKQAGIGTVHGALLPEDKVERIRTLEAEGRTVCMIGDGVNDAPALKTATVGVAMGSMGSDMAVEAADIALMGDDIGKLPYLKRLSAATVRLIKLNITLAMAVNFVAIFLSFLGVLGPISGALVHNAGAVLIVLNAAMLYDRKFDVNA